MHWPAHIRSGRSDIPAIVRFPVSYQDAGDKPQRKESQGTRGAPGRKANELRTLQAKGGEEVRGTEEAIITHGVESDK